MQHLFVDASFYIALLNRNDDFHQRAVALAIELDTHDGRSVTSQVVLFEVFAYFSRAGVTSRSQVAELFDRIRDSPTTELVRTSEALMHAAVDLYRQRLDKRYSLADCLAMVICRARRITDVLTTDRDFQSEGFTILLDR